MKSMLSMSRNIYLDANVLLEAVLKRENKAKADKLIHETSGSSYISALTAHIVMYFGSKDLEIFILQQFLADFNMLPLEQSDFEWAYNNRRNNDFEDALQLAVAIRNGCEQFMTFDKTLYETYKSLPQLKIKFLK